MQLFKVNLIMRLVHFIVPIIFGVISYICFINGNYFGKIFNLVHNLIDVYILGKPLDISRSTNEKLFTKLQLSSFDGTNGKLYLSILGRVFDVTKGKKYYAPGEHYHGFTGRDASRAFITGDFSQKGLTDDLSNLLLSDLIGLKDWLKRYEKDYIYKGKLIGRFYDENGRSSSYLRDIESKCQEAFKLNEQNEYYNLKYPPCNIEWSKEKGSRVWCSMKSGGVRRNWIGVPRKIFLPGLKDFRCACINPDLESVIDGAFLHFENLMASLVADYGESSQESSEESENDSHFDKSESVINERLPPPAFTNKIKNSVFVNPYLEAENAKFAVLEKHVKMVPQNNNATGSKKICWMFKKGKCRFGKKCKFSHHMEDACSQPNSLNQQDVVTKELDSNSIVSDQTKIVVENENLINNSQENLSDEDNNSMKKRKKQVGPTQGLIPSKKVIKMYKKRRVEENKLM